MADIPRLLSPTEKLRLKMLQIQPRETLMWKPKAAMHLNKNELSSYMELAKGAFSLSPDTALNILHFHAYDLSKAVECARFQFNRNKWTKLEKYMFVRAFGQYGKNFSLIKEKFLPHKSVAELVYFYYRRGKRYYFQKIIHDRAVRTRRACAKYQK